MKQITSFRCRFLETPPISEDNQFSTTLKMPVVSKAAMRLVGFSRKVRQPYPLGDLYLNNLSILPIYWEQSVTLYLIL